MTAEPRGEADRPKRRRRRRRPARGANPAAAETQGSPDGTDSPSGPPPTEGGEEPGVRRRRRRRGASGRAATASQLGTGDIKGGDQPGEGKRHGGNKARRAKARRAKARRAKGASAKGASAKGASAKGASAKGASAKGASAKAGGRRIPTQKEISAGGVVYRFAGDGTLEVVLASRRTRRGDLAWGLAKGGIEEGETAEDAAVREVREETGIVAEIEESLGDTRYMYVWGDVRIRKTVHFFLMKSMGGDTDDRDDEMEEVRWFPLERALKRAAYRGERDVLGRAAELLR